MTGKSDQRTKESFITSVYDFQLQ